MRFKTKIVKLILELGFTFFDWLIG